MTPESHRKICDIYYSASEITPAERPAFLDEACGGDEALRREVESMLAARDRAGDYFAAPAMEVAAGLMAEENYPSLAGQSLGHYQVLSLIGAGGMGEVYLAEDTRLRRKVALKLLPAQFMRDADRARRFEREARAASSLNHPNIITIFEVGQVDGRHFICAEYIEGQTLRRRLAGDQLKLHETLDVAVQIASALTSAHAAGIFHRDIKPENIMLRHDGLVKLLDFGLAKLRADGETEGQRDGGTDLQRDGAMERHPVSSSPGHSGSLSLRPPVSISLPLSTTGVAMGTLQYMSPEQARGEKVEGRSDIFSLGIVLYQMITGWPPFEGETSDEVIAAILEREPPPLAQYAREAPAELQRIVTKALRKKREDRYQAAPDLLLDLKALKEEMELETKGLRRRRSKARAARHITTTVIALMIMVAAAIAIKRLIGKPTIPFQKVDITRLTNNRNIALSEISPDGKYIAYVDREKGNSSLLLRQVATDSVQEIVPPAMVVYSDLAFSADGGYVYFVRSPDKTSAPRALYRVPVLGGSPVKLIDDLYYHFTLSPDGSQIAFARRRFSEGKIAIAMMIANANGSGERRLAARASNEPYEFPAWSPDGEVIVCTNGPPGREGNQRGITELRVKDGAERSLTSQKWQGVGRKVWMPDGSGLFFDAYTAEKQRRQIWYLPYPGGEPRPVTIGLDHCGHISLTADLKIMLCSQQNLISDIWSLPEGDTSRARKLSAGRGPSLAPDGRIVYESDFDGDRDVWMMNQDGTGRKNLTSAPGRDGSPRVTPDGRYILFTSVRSGAPEIWRMEIDGSNPVQLTRSGNAQMSDISPDGKWAFYGTSRGFEKVPIAGGEPVAFTSKHSMLYPSVSPDGKLIAYYYSEKQPGAKVKIAVSPSSGGQPVWTFDPPREAYWTFNIRWTPDGKALLYEADHNGVSNIWLKSLNGEPPKRLTDFRSESILAFDLSRDGKHLICTRGGQTFDLVLVRDVSDR
jgi:serine/threonine protein kinase/Tol biopolymer transport system component